MTVFALIWWAAWWAMLIIGDPLLIWLGGEKLSDTHFIATHVIPSLRAAGIAWLAWHLLIEHLKG